MPTTTIIIFGIILVLAIFVIGIYNSLITSNNKVNEAWADIETQLKRRYDLIPNMVETIKGYAKHESKTLEAVISARNSAINAKSPEQKIQAENTLSGTLKSLFAVVESYPDLKANHNFLDLQQTLKDIEEKIQLSRRYYNGTVRDFNTAIQVFPNNLLAGIFNFKNRTFFEIENAEERNNPKVNFTE